MVTKSANYPLEFAKGIFNAKMVAVVTYVFLHKGLSWFPERKQIPSKKALLALHCPSSEADHGRISFPYISYKHYRTFSPWL